jgi:hypothetical protein
VSGEDVDTRIRQLIRRDRVPSDQDAVDVLDRIADATFYLGRRNIPEPLQDLMRQHGYPVPDRGNDLIFHWAKHVLGDKQWTPDTTPADYWQDAQDAIRHEESQLVVLNAASGHDVAIVIAKTANVVPDRRLGPRAGDEVLVIYSATTGRILSVHMVESSFRLTAGTSTVWLPR